jgi:hypothetical protein
VGIIESVNIPDHFSLSQNYPNPFNPSTKITYTLPWSVNVKLRIYDLLGREVATLVNGELKAGVYNETFDGSTLASGIYFYRIEARQVGSLTGSFIDVKKMVLIK